MSTGRKPKRKTVTIDRAVADTIKELAARHGMTINSYLKSLVEAVKELEDMGLYAPAVIREYKSIAVLSRLGMVTVPLELLNYTNCDRDTAMSSGMRIGRALKELRVDVAKVVEMLGMQYKAIIPTESSLIVVGSGRSGEILASVVKGVALGGGLEVSAEGDVVTIKIERKSIG
jgi:hypothetical protein